MKYKVGDRVKIVDWLGEDVNRDRVIGKTVVIYEVGWSHNYPYAFELDGFYSRLNESEIVFDKEYNVKRLLDAVDDINL